MVRVEDLHPGMRVKIVDHLDAYCWRDENSQMDKWCGKIVTVSEVSDGYIIVEEDAGDGPEYQNGHWKWPERAIDMIVEDDTEDEDFEAASVDDILSLICGY